MDESELLARIKNLAPLERVVVAARAASRVLPVVAHSDQVSEEEQSRATYTVRLALNAVLIGVGDEPGEPARAYEGVVGAAIRSGQAALTAALYEQGIHAMHQIAPARYQGGIDTAYVEQAVFFSTCVTSDAASEVEQDIQDLVDGVVHPRAESASAAGRLCAPMGPIDTGDFSARGASKPITSLALTDLWRVGAEPDWSSIVEAERAGFDRPMSGSFTMDFTGGKATKDDIVAFLTSINRVGLSRGAPPLRFTSPQAGTIQAEFSTHE